MTGLERVIARYMPQPQPTVPVIREQPSRAWPSPESTVTSTFTEIDEAREDRVLTRLARLTEEHGPWEAARRIDWSAT